MGVPAFYRWLSEKYPKTIKDVIEESPMTVDGEVRSHVPLQTPIMLAAGGASGHVSRKSERT